MVLSIVSMKGNWSLISFTEWTHNAHSVFFKQSMNVHYVDSLYLNTPFRHHGRANGIVVNGMDLHGMRSHSPLDLSHNLLNLPNKIWVLSHNICMGFVA